ncbi:ROK family protein [Rhizobium mongolense subsp. loessense]|uniref:ROK family protein n=1 Tax=Rhizobium mongolense subsp. loessense TaxID=158890 RepID=A0A1G4QLY1_9HYPH|nr:ROK family protein [Rhizobium mongolense subsp. loessense]
MAHAAEPYMLDQWQSRSGSSISRDEFARSVERQEDLALSILSDGGSRIGRHLADMVNLFDPEIIVVGGEAVQFGDALLDPVRKTMEVSPSRNWSPTGFRVPGHGAAALATQIIFDFERSPSGRWAAEAPGFGGIAR